MTTTTKRFLCLFVLLQAKQNELLGSNDPWIQDRCLIRSDVGVDIYIYKVSLVNPMGGLTGTEQEEKIDHRCAESSRIRSKYPDRIPVVVEKAPKSSIPDIDKRKFLTPSDLTVAQFMYIIRKRIQLPPDNAMFLFVNKVLPATSSTMGAIYEEHKDDDGFLYIAYSGDNTFG